MLIPIHTELLFELELEYAKRKPRPEDRVLPNPLTGRNLTRSRLYGRMLALGRRVGIPNVHPHRFRDTLAVDLLLKGASPYHVAKLLGDTVQTVETHYATFTKELRGRARRLMESGEGLQLPEQPSTLLAHSQVPKRTVQ